MISTASRASPRPRIHSMTPPSPRIPASSSARSGSTARNSATSSAYSVSRTGQVCSMSPSQRPATGLFALDRLEKRLEVALAEAARAVPLDDFEEQCRSIFHRLGENLQHVSFVVAIDQDAQLGQVAQVF